MSKKKKHKTQELGPPFVYPKHAMTKAFGDIRFRHYPCGYTPDEHNQIIYVKYKPSHKQFHYGDTRILSADIDHVHFDFPDREIFISKNNFALGGARPFNRPKSGDGWHKAVSLTPITSVGDDLPFDRFMINPHAYTDKTEPRFRDKRTVYRTDKIVIADSSAFQLGHGQITFIDPDHLCRFYRRSADEGIVLDIPSRRLGDNEEILAWTAKVQNLNTTYMKERLPKDFRVATVIHGLNLKLVDLFRGIMEKHDADFPIACISGALRFNLLESIHRIIYIVQSGQRYNQYHLLGVGGPVFLALLIRLAYKYKHAGEKILFTADSSTGIMMASAHTYFSQPAWHSGLTLQRFGLKLDTNKDAPAGNVANPHRRIASTDPITQIVGGYQDIISSYNVAATRTYIKYINQIEAVRYINMMCHYADVLDAPTFKALIKEQFKGSAHIQIMMLTLDYLEMAFQDGYKKAYEKYKYYMPTFSGETSLHKFPAMQENEDQKEEEITRAAIKKHVVKVLKNYLHFHKTGKKPKSFVNKNHIANQLTNKNMM